MSLAGNLKAETKKDATIKQSFLGELKEANRESFTDLILTYKTDSVVFFYNTKTTNYYQRREAFQINLLAKTLKSKIADIEKKINFYSYDVTLSGIPEGIEEITYLQADTKSHKSGWSAIYLFPADLKT